MEMTVYTGGSGCSPSAVAAAALGSREQALGTTLAVGLTPAWGLISDEPQPITSIPSAATAAARPAGLPERRRWVTVRLSDRVVGLLRRAGPRRAGEGTPPPPISGVGPWVSAAARLGRFGRHDPLRLGPR